MRGFYRFSPCVLVAVIMSSLGLARCFGCVNGGQQNITDLMLITLSIDDENKGNADFDKLRSMLGGIGNDGVVFIQHSNNVPGEFGLSVLLYAVRLPGGYGVVAFSEEVGVPEEVADRVCEKLRAGGLKISASAVSCAPFSTSIVLAPEDGDPQLVAVDKVATVADLLDQCKRSYYRGIVWLPLDGYYDANPDDGNVAGMDCVNRVKSRQVVPSTIYYLFMGCVF